MKCVMNRGCAVAMLAVAGTASSALGQVRDWTYSWPQDGYWLMEHWWEPLGQIWGVAQNGPTPGVARIPTGRTVDALSGGELRIWQVYIAAGGTVTNPSRNFKLTTQLDSSNWAFPPGLVNDGSFITLPTGSVQFWFDDQTGTATHTNNGLFQVQGGSGNTAYADIRGRHVFLGAGRFELAGDGTAYVNWTGSGFDSIVNGQNHTFGGTGWVSDRVPILNFGIVEANLGLTLGVPVASNAGTLRATNGGTLSLYAPNNGGYSYLANDGGTIHAADGSLVRLESTADVRLGTLSSAGTGYITVVNNNSRIRGVTITQGSELRFANHRGVLMDAITNNGQIRVTTTGPESGPLLNNAMTLAGTGELKFEGGSIHWMGSNQEHLTNGAQHLIHGWGTVNSGPMRITNHGTIRADAAGQTLALVHYGQGFENNGVIEATGGATLQLVNGGGSAVNNGQIMARAASRVALWDARIIGGTLGSQGDGFVEVANNTPELTDVTIPAGSLVRIGDGRGAKWLGTITNNGVVRAESAGNPGQMLMGTPMTFAGTGEVLLQGGIIHWTGTGVEHLTNSAGHRIRGYGNATSGNIRMTNNGTISADAAGQTLHIAHVGGGFTNNSVIEAVNGGVLQLNDGGGVATNNGQFTARAGSKVVLSGAKFQGGALGSEDTGRVELINNGELRGATIPAGSVVKIPNGHQYMMVGTITNNGSMRLEPTGGNSVLLLSSPVTFAGSGEIVLGGAGAMIHWTGSGQEVLTNGPQHTIRGVGGGTTVALINQGTLSPGQGAPTTVFSTFGMGRTITCEPTSVIALKIGGPGAGQYDQVVSGQAFTAGGELRLSLANGYEPGPGSSFTIITGSSVGGAFSSLVLPALPGGRVWYIRYESSQVRAVVGACPADIATEGNPDPEAGPDGFITGVDFDLFVQAFFKEQRNASGTLLADLTDGFGTGGPDGYVTGTDFDYFVQLFFTGCP